MVNKHSDNEIIKTDIEKLKGELDSVHKFVAGKRILITGGSGFIGSYLCEVLSRLGGNIICIDNLSSGKLENILYLKKEKNFRFVKHDIKYPFSKYKCDIIFHLASRAARKEWENYPVDVILTNSTGSYNTLELARKNDALVVFASTSEIYGNPTIVPTPESYNGNVNCINSRSAYDESKRFAESLFIGYAKQFGLKIKIARIFNTYGPRLVSGIYGRVISRFIQQALTNKPITVYGDGYQTRSFNYIADTIDGLIRVFSFGKNRDVYNIGNDKEVSIIKVVELIKNIIKSGSPIVFRQLPEDDPIRRRPDLSKAQKILNYYPKISLEHGLKRTIEWYRNSS